MGFTWKWLIYLVPAVFGTFAFMTSLLFSFWCQSIQFVPDSTSASSNNNATTTSSTINPVSYGPWYMAETVQTPIGTVPGGGGDIRGYMTSTVCVAFPSNTEIDPFLKTVRAFSIMTPILGGLLTVGLWLAPCLYRFEEASWKMIATMFIVFLTLFQGLTFLIYRSNLCTDTSMTLGGAADLFTTECQWDEGSTSNVVSVILWFLTGVSMMMIGVPKRAPRPPPETQQVTYQQTTNPDGTKTVQQVAVVKGTAVDPIEQAEHAGPPQPLQEQKV